MHWTNCFHSQFDSFKTAQNFYHTVQNTNPVTISLSVCCIVVLAIFKFYINPRVYAKLRFPLPIELIMVSDTMRNAKFGAVYA